VRRLRVGIKGLSTWHATLLASLMLLGCHKHNKSYLPLEDDTYKLPRRVAGTSDAQVAAMIKTFNRGRVVKVISIGSDYLISMPSAALFPDQSPRLVWQSYPLLNQVARFLKQFRKVGVNVTSYSGKYVSDKREHALTLARARAVGDYLWSQGIDSRFIFTEGMGSDKPISSYNGIGDNSPSSRIEITFRDTVA
jgi:intracellular multiplication protein IcmN